MQSRVPKYNGDPHGPDGKLLSNFIPFAVLKSQNRRIYNDEVTRPDAEFCFNRMKHWTTVKERPYSFSTMEPCYIWKIWGRLLERNSSII